MDRSQGCGELLASSPVVLRNALVVACAVFAVTWHFLPRSPASRVVAVTVPASISQAAGDDNTNAEASVHRFIVRAGSPQLKRLQQLSADSHKTSSSGMPPRYYADQWRMTAAQYYYERELKRERDAATAGAGEPATLFGSSYWQREIDQAEARQQALLASLPAPVAVERPVVAMGEWIAGRPERSWALAAVAAAALSALGMWWLQSATFGGSVPGDCQPRMQVHLPADWFRQSPSLGQRLTTSVVVAGWLSILGCFAANLR